MKKPQPVLIWCQACQTGYGSTGELPTICPRCDSDDPRWTRTPPYKLTVDDQQFLKAHQIDPA